MSGLSFTRRRILHVLDRTLSSHTDTFYVFRDAFSDYATGARWMAQKEDTLSRMAAAGLIERVDVQGARESHWRITDKGRRTLSRAQARSA